MKRVMMFCLFAASARAALVYQTGGEFLTTGDFNGDGVADLLVLDKLTGNARVGYGGAGGAFIWSAPLVTGVQEAAGCAVGRFLQTTRDAIAVTAPDFNRINLVDLSGTNAAGAPVIVTPFGVGPHMLIALPNPSGGTPPPYNFLLAASSFNDGSAERLDLMSLNAGVATPAGQFNETGPFERGNALQLASNPASLAAGLVRGTNDTLDLWQFTGTPGVALVLSNLPPGSDYAFGIFNGESLPRFLFYQPGASNLTIVPLQQQGSRLAFGAAVPVAFTEAIQHVYYLPLGSDGTALIQFGDGIRGLRLPGGSPLITPALYNQGLGGAGNVFTGIVPLSGGQVALLDAPPGSLASVHVQVTRFDGTNFTLLSSGNLPATSAGTTRADLWLFEAEPFVNRQPGFIASVNSPDWSDAIIGLPGSLTVVKESDGGTTTGLGTAGTNNLGAPPPGSVFGLPNQYNSAISLFSFAGPQSPEPVIVTISPPPGPYGGPIQVGFITLNPTDRVLYRASVLDVWHVFAAAFLLTNDSVVQFYGVNPSKPSRSHLQFASYSVGHNGQPPPTLDLSTGSSTTNPPQPPVVTNVLTISPVGTLFYGRRAPASLGTIWAINLDGSGETFVTAGARPRVSQDGHWLAFLRGTAPLVTMDSLWVRHLPTGQETLLYNNTNFIIGYEWDLNQTNLVFDWSCWLWTIPVGGTPTRLPLATDCYDDAPAVNPVDGRLAFHNLNPNPAIAGLYVTTPGRTNKLRLNLNVPGASWPAWSPDGALLAFADNNTNLAFTADGGTNLYVVRPDGTGLSQITAFSDGTNGFPHGAWWLPSGDALVGAGSIFGTNGLWIIPLTPDRTDCAGMPILLPTSPGDPIDFAGDIAIAPAPTTPPRLFVRLEPDALVVYWNTNLSAYALEYATDLAPPATWTSVTNFIPTVGFNFEYREPIANLAPEKYFRLTARPRD